jgi:hypothetical protein
MIFFLAKILKNPPQTARHRPKIIQNEQNSITPTLYRHKTDVIQTLKNRRKQTHGKL